MIPRNVDVTVKLIEDQQSGKLTGRTELTLALVDVTVDGKQVPVVTQEVTQASESRTGRTAKVVGGTAALGAIIGAIAGGGKGAAVGATTGAGAGAAVQVLTKGQRVRIPSETRLTFTLKEPVRL
jgi:ADP-ribosylglycohydrolase